MTQIVVGNTYYATFGTVKIKVVVLRPAAIAGWWFCETVDSGDQLIVREHSLSVTT